MQDSSPAQYDALPYEGHPDPMIHPDRMAAAAWLHGVEAAPLEKARVLEIGCATGAHLVPMAYQFPEASFVGFDYSSAQIAIAKAATSAVGLDNIQFEQRDIRDPHEDLGEFDYIFAHGVFSWVPRAVQDALLEICRRHLAPSGVALVDYNVYPGWHLRDFLRDLVAFHHADHSDLATLTTASLNSLNFVAGHLFAPGQPFGQSVGHLQRWAMDQSRNYLAHEFGSAPSHPVMFSEFAGRARDQELEILGDAEIVHVIPAQFAESLAAKLDEVAGSDYVRREQYLDFLRGRDFRRTLLVKEGVRVSRQILPNAMRRLRFSTVARYEALPQGALFRTPDGTMLRTVNEPLIRSLRELCNAGAPGLTYEAMLRCGGPEADGSPAAMEAFTASLLEAAASALVQIHAHVPRVVHVVSEKPLANALARTAGAAGREVATSMLHRDWHIDIFERHLLALLDGTRPRQKLGGILMQQVEKGEIPPEPNGHGIQRGVRQYVEAHLTSSLDWFARVGMLIG